jgi:hypothetical protein
MCSALEVHDPLKVEETALQLADNAADDLHLPGSAV